VEAQLATAVEECMNARQAGSGGMEEEAHALVLQNSQDQVVRKAAAWCAFTPTVNRSRRRTAPRPAATKQRARNAASANRANKQVLPEYTRAENVHVRRGNVSGTGRQHASTPANATARYARMAKTLSQTTNGDGVPNPAVVQNEFSMEAEGRSLSAACRMQQRRTPRTQTRKENGSQEVKCRGR